VSHMKTGFTFNGSTYDEKIKNMLTTFDIALDVYANDREKWKKIQASAKRMRFTWEKSVDRYYKQLYDLV
ncbi:MAG: glycogen synthase, partial [Bacteroidota bacterium]